MVSISIVFFFCHFAVITFSVSQQSPGPSLCCSLSLFFSRSFMSLSMQSTIAISVFLTSCFPLHILGICSFCQFFISHSFYTRPVLFNIFIISLFLKTFLHFNIHSHLIRSSFVRSLNSRVWFANLDLLLLFLSKCHRL